MKAIFKFSLQALQKIVFILVKSPNKSRDFLKE